MICYDVFDEMIIFTEIVDLFTLLGSEQASIWYKKCSSSDSLAVNWRPILVFNVQLHQNETLGLIFLLFTGSIQRF